MPESICSICLRKLLATNVFRKQCLSAEFELKKMQTDHNERKLLKEIENRMHVQTDASDDYNDASDIIEYIVDETFEMGEISDTDENGAFDDTDRAHNGQHQDYNELKVEVLSVNDDDDVDDDDEDEDDGDHYRDDGFENYSVICSNDEQNEERSNSEDQSSTITGSNRRGGLAKRQRKMCPICGKLVVNLKPHVETHQKREKRRKPYKCSYCGKEFLQRAQFDGHVNKEHTGARPFSCDQCDKKFHGRPTLRMVKPFFSFCSLFDVISTTSGVLLFLNFSTRFSTRMSDDSHANIVISDTATRTICRIIATHTRRCVNFRAINATTRMCIARICDDTSAAIIRRSSNSRRWSMCARCAIGSSAVNRIWYDIRNWCTRCIWKSSDAGTLDHFNVSDKRVILILFRSV